MPNSRVPSDKAILVVEDNPTLRYLVRRQLTRLGHNCDVAEDGAEAVRKESIKHYDLILMDVQMPIMSGLEATRSIRARENTTPTRSHIPIIAVTANPDTKQCYDAGMNDFLFKPVSIAQLNQTITHWLNEPLSKS